MSDRVYVLRRYKDGVEVPYDGEDENLIEALEKYRQIVDQYSDPMHTLNSTYNVAPNGLILAFFNNEFPAEALPVNGGFSNFKVGEYQYYLELEGAKKLETLCFAAGNHGLHKCKPYLCVDQYCHNYCAALDEHLFMPAGSTFFIRYSPENCTDAEQFKPVSISEPIELKNNKDEVLCSGVRAVPITKDEFLVDVPDPSKFIKTKGYVKVDNGCYELMPCPTDASQLDMHLAHLSTIDTKYVMRFGLEVTSLFEQKVDIIEEEDDEQEEEDEEDEESEDEGAYVESALIPGLRKYDFYREIPAEKALCRLKVSDSEAERLRAILAE